MRVKAVSGISGRQWTLYRGLLRSVSGASEHLTAALVFFGPPNLGHVRRQAGAGWS